MTVEEIVKSYNKKLDHLDIEVILAHSLKKTREFILTHPEFIITKNHESRIMNYTKRRLQGEPTAYITGHREFYGLDFVVNKNTLVPRPETEMLVELALDKSKVKSQKSKVIIIDVGTGSGNIIISLAHTLDSRFRGNDIIKYFAIDISNEALTVAKKNAKEHGLDKKITFLNGDLLSPLLKANELTKLMPNKLIIVANLPYLSKKIYSSAIDDVKKYEPKSALYSSEAGLSHYHKLLEQIKKMLTSHPMFHITCLWEISPEQKRLLTKLIKNILPSAKIIFTKDLAGKWRICKISL